MRKTNLLGQTFGRLTVIAQAPTMIETRWKCKCKCGRNTIKPASLLKSGRAISCGCARIGRKYPNRKKPGEGEPGPRYDAAAAIMLADALGLPSVAK